MIFVSFIDSLTPWHLRILKLFDNPKAWFEINNITKPNIYSGGLSHILEVAYPQLRGRRDLYDQLFKDLFSKGLVSIDGLHTTMSEHGLYESRTTDLGKQFLNFITNPLEKQ